MRSPPRAALVATSALLGGLLCSCLTPQELDGFHAAYATHFEGVPDRSVVCARFTNRADYTLDWIELRMEAHDDTGEVPARWRSRWIYRGPIEAGERVALELVDPPFATRVELRVGGTGTGSPRRASRPLVRSDACSDAVLSARLLERSAQRAAVQVVRVTPSEEGELVAEEH